MVLFIAATITGCNEKQNGTVINNSTNVQPPVTYVPPAPVNLKDKEAIVLGAHCTEVIDFLKIPNTETLFAKEIYTIILDIVNVDKYNAIVRDRMNKSGLEFSANNKLSKEEFTKLMRIFTQIQEETNKITGAKP